MFNDFMKVAMEAKKNLKEMQTRISASKVELDTLKQNRYEAMYIFWQDVAKILIELGCDNTHIAIRTPIKYFQNGKQYTVYFKIWAGKPNRIELGTYAIYSGINLDSGWRRWIQIPETYKKYAYQNQDISNVAQLMYDNWEEYQPTLEVAIKEMVTSFLAKQLNDTEIQFAKIQNDIAIEEMK